MINSDSNDGHSTVESDSVYSLSEEYGRKSRIFVGRLFIFGLLTLWIYTIIKYHRTLKLHEIERLKYFEKLIGHGELSSGRELLDQLRYNGVSRTFFHTIICIVLNLVAVALLAIEAYGIFAPGYKIPYAELIFELPYGGIGIAGLLFYVSSIIYIARSAAIMKRHEFLEFRLVLFYKNHHNFPLSKYPSLLAKQWTLLQSKLLFYILFSLPAALTPYIAASSIASVLKNGGGHIYYIYGWAALIGFLAVFFSYWLILSLKFILDKHLNMELANKWNLLVRNVEGGQDFVAIMITDMVGFSKIMEIDEKAAYSKLKEHNDTIRQIINLYGGVEVKTMGDAFLVRFYNTIDAVNAAIDIQIVFGIYNQERERGEHIFLRIGVHYGKVIIEENDIMGNGVNVTARIEPLAIPSCIAITREVYKRVAGKVQADILKFGRKKLKNISELLELYMVVPGGDEEMQADKVEIIKAFLKHNWDFDKTAKALSVNRQDLMDKIKQYGIIYYAELNLADAT